MRFTGFIGPSYQLRSVNVECQRCINLYPEVDELGTEKDHGVAALIGTPGLTFLAALGTGPVRCIYVATNGTMYAVSGAAVFQVNKDYTFTSLGSLTTQSGPVSMVDNTITLVIVDGSLNYWTVPLATNILTKVTDPNFVGATQVAVADGMFVFNTPGSNQFYISNLLSTTINPIGFSSNNGLDQLIGFVWDHRNLWLFGKNSSEIWFDSGAGIGGTTGNPFQIVQGGFMQVGCAAAFSIVQMANTIMWLGRDPNGQGVVYMTNGYMPQRISNHAVELSIQSYGDISGAVAYSYQENGHNFYVLNIGTDTTWVFDTQTQLWHERAYTNQGILQRHLANTHAFFNNTHIVGDYVNGAIYSMSSSVYQDTTSSGIVPITRRRASPHISNDMTRVFHSSFQLDMEPAVGLDGTTQGITPQAVLQFSDDGGHNWSNEKWAGIGRIGKTKTRIIWRRLGQSRDRVYRITITDPVKVVLIGAELGIEAGAS